MRLFTKIIVVIIFATQICCVKAAWLMSPKDQVAELSKYYEREKNKQKVLNTLLVFWVNNEKNMAFKKEGRVEFHTLFSKVAMQLADKHKEQREFEKSLLYLSKACRHSIFASRNSVGTHTFYIREKTKNVICEIYAKTKVILLLKSRIKKNRKRQEKILKRLRKNNKRQKEIEKELEKKYKKILKDRKRKNELRV